MACAEPPVIKRAKKVPRAITVAFVFPISIPDQIAYPTTRVKNI